MIMIAIRTGVARGLFSNEAGQGSTAIAHAVAQTNDPAVQGRFAMMGTFIDTIVICTMTALVMLTVGGDFTATVGGQQIAVEHAWQSDLQGFAMTSGAYAAAFPLELLDIPIGTLIASIALLLFVFTSLMTWSYYGERAIAYLYDQLPGATRSGELKLHLVWRMVWCLMIFIGSFQDLTLVWRLGDISNAAMALPNIVALMALSGVIFALARGNRTAGTDHGRETPKELQGDVSGAPGH